MSADSPVRPIVGVMTPCHTYLMTKTASAPRKLINFGSDLRKGMTVKAHQVNGTTVTGTIARITVADRKTGQRKATMTSGQVAFINTNEVYAR